MATLKSSILRGFFHNFSGKLGVCVSRSAWGNISITLGTYGWSLLNFSDNANICIINKWTNFWGANANVKATLKSKMTFLFHLTSGLMEVCALWVLFLVLNIDSQYCITLVWPVLMILCANINTFHCDKYYQYDINIGLTYFHDLCVNINILFTILNWFFMCIYAF